ncbi:hypothetical protein GCM10022222_10480 [Amycolatopsis ultiminotia]|uniref:Uncharacterized protein n=2 Tax=Amycolatopsis ultiminotia TaxID=543629 RepID=A0ABP6V5Z9_9PSEU
MPIRDRLRSACLREWVVFLGGMPAGVAVGALVLSVFGITDTVLVWHTTAGDVTTVPAGLLGSLLAAKLLLPPTEQVRWARIPATTGDAWPGARFGGAALVAAPLLLVAGEVLRIRYHYYFPAQLAAVAGDRGLILVSYALYSTGLLLLVPAFLAFANLIKAELPGWAFWGATLAVLGDLVRLFHEGVNHLALHLVPVDGLAAATHGVSATYQSWYVFYPLVFADNLGWLVLAIGAYRARVLSRLPAIALAVMAVHSSGVLKGSDLGSLSADLAICAALVPLGVARYRRAAPAARTTRLGGWAALVALAVLYAYHLLVVLPHSP